MSHYREQPFGISKGDHGGWVVDFEGKAISVSSRSDAVLLADLPVELCKAVSNEHKPDLNKIRRILALCDEYRLGYISGVHQLKSWFKRNRR